MLLKITQVTYCDNMCQHLCYECYNEIYVL